MIPYEPDEPDASLLDLVSWPDDGTVPGLLDPLSYLKAILGGRYSGIPDCCIRYHVEHLLPTEFEPPPEPPWRPVLPIGYKPCVECRTSGRDLPVARACPHPCACSRLVDRVAALLHQVKLADHPRGAIPDLDPRPPHR
jgi:hypothetical protein